MTHAYLGVAALDVLLLAAGLAFLYGLGLVRSARQAVRWSGLGLFVAWALTGVLGSLEAMAGLALTVPELIVTIAVIAAAGLLLGRRIPAAPRRPQPSAGGLAAWIAVGGAAVLLVYLEALFRRARLSVTTSWDAWAFWIPKAESIVYFHGIGTGPGRFESFANPDYPPMAPVMDAVTFRFMGRIDPAVLPPQHWVIVVAFLGAIAALLATRVPPVVLWPSLAGLALLPDFGGLVGSSLGDEPLSLVFGVAGVCAALWLLEREPRYAALVVVCMTAAALTKFEGLTLALLLASILALGGSTRRYWRAPVAVALLPVLVRFAWKVWLHTHHVVTTGAYSFSKLIHPGFLWHRIGRFDAAVSALPGYLLDPGRWFVTVPVALALALLLAWRRGALTLLVLGTAVTAFFGLAAVYWVSAYPVHWYLATSASRVVSSTAIFCGALLPLLLAEALAAEEQPATAPQPT